MMSRICWGLRVGWSASISDAFVMAGPDATEHRRRAVTDGPPGASPRPAGGVNPPQSVTASPEGRLEWQDPGPLAQLARALASHARGHWFKSSTVHAVFPGRSGWETEASSDIYRREAYREA